MSAALVAQIKDDLIRRGVIPPKQEDNGDSAQICWRVAWALRHVGAQLIRKSPAQNAWTAETGPYAGQRFSHDSIALSNGWVDCLANAGPPANENRPVWLFTASAPAPPSTVAAPYDLDALLDEPSEPDTPPPPPDPTPSADTLAELTLAMTAQTTHLRHLVEALQLQTDAIAEVADLVERVLVQQAKGLVIPYLGLATPPH